MKLSIIYTISVSLIILSSGCSIQPNSKFVQVDNKTSDYCVKFDKVNEFGKEVSMTNYTIKTVEIDENGNKVEIKKVVDCGV